MASRDYEANFIDEHQDELIRRVTAVSPIMDELLSQRVIHNPDALYLAFTGQYSTRRLLQDVDFGGKQAKSALYKLLKKYEPRLVKELESRQATSKATEEELLKLKLERKRMEEQKSWIEILRAKLKCEKEETRDAIQRETKERAFLKWMNKTELRSVVIGIPMRKCMSAPLPLNFSDDKSSHEFYSRIQRNLTVGQHRPESDLRLVLVGRSASGKTSVANGILGRRAFVSSAYSSVVNEGLVDRCKISLVDTPDWFTTELPNEVVKQDVMLSMDQTSPGPHAFLLVTPIQQCDVTRLDKIVTILGQNCLSYTFVLFTHFGELKEKTAEEFINTEPNLKQTIQRCGNRYHVLNINQLDDGFQVSQLLKKLMEMVEKSSGSYYSSEMYKEAEIQIREMEESLKRKKAEEREKEEREARDKYERELEETVKKMEGEIQEKDETIKELEEKISELEEELKVEKDENKKKLIEMELNKQVELRERVDKQIEKLKEKIEMEKKEREETHQREIEMIRQNYESEVQMEAERRLMEKIIPEFFSRLQSMSTTKIHGECQRQMQEKDREIERVLEEKTEMERVIEEKTEEMKVISQRLNTAVDQMGNRNDEFQWKALISLSLILFILYFLSNVWEYSIVTFILTISVVFIISSAMSAFTDWSLSRIFRTLRELVR